MLNIRTANITDAEMISVLAHQIWPVAYQTILPAEQIDLMLSQTYTPERLQEQFSKGDVFLLAEVDQMPAGFASYSYVDVSEGVYRLHKLYILPHIQKRGLGGLLISEMIKRVKQGGGKSIELNVNRRNLAAIGFYKRIGFKVRSEIDIPYHQFILDDYIMNINL